jgi:CHAD domain-containing protein
MHFIENKKGHKHFQAQTRASVLKRIESDIKQTENVADKLRKNKHVDARELHNFRVGLRRIQASVRVLGQVNDDARIQPTLEMVKNLLKVTSALRAEQVLPKMLHVQNQGVGPLDLMQGRARILAELEGALAGDFEKYLPQDFGDSIRQLVLEPFSDVASKKFKKRAEALVERDCHRLKAMALKLGKHKLDVGFQHKLRIRAKRLGYILELLEPELRPKVHKIESLIKQNQKVFGSLHDLDCAIEEIGRGSPRLKVAEQQSLLKHLRNERPAMLQKALKKGRRLAKNL